MITELFNVKITFTEPVLGSDSGNKNIQEEFISSKADTTEKILEELATIPVQEQIEKSMTIFPCDEVGLLVWDYQIRGSIKEALNALMELGEAPAVLNPWNISKIVDNFVYVTSRRNYLMNPETNKPWQKAPSTLQRPLRGRTMQGERIALANSEMLPAGTWFECQFKCLVGATEPTEGKNGKKKRGSLACVDAEVIQDCLNFNGARGWGQWRGGGFGTFKWEKIT